MNRRGFSIIEVIVVVVVVAIIGAAGYLYFNQPISNNEAADNTPATYQSNYDLDVASDELESTTIDTEMDGLLQELDREAAAF